MLMSKRRGHVMTMMVCMSVVRWAGNDMRHMGRENMETACGSPIGKSGHSAAEKDMEEDVGVHTEGGASP